MIIINQAVDRYVFIIFLTYRARVGEGGWLEGWLGCLLCLGGPEWPCNTCIALRCISITFPQTFSLTYPHMRHRQPHTFQQAPPATSPMRDMLTKFVRAPDIGSSASGTLSDPQRSWRVFWPPAKHPRHALVTEPQAALAKRLSPPRRCSQ